MSTYKTLFALFGAPAAWIMQMLLSESLTAYACYPYQEPLSAPLWTDLPAILAAISITCLTLNFISAYVAWSFWQQSNNPMIDKINTREQSLKIVGGQSQFLAMLGIMSNVVFFVAILFTSCAILLVPLCSEWA
ncbi:MAG: hypothetical protein H6940_04595 [Burkholderiales bacterium]|uniref:hypothetical protein n=1 Tax=Nitrosomonas sp. TaxID=42353 RepID=UPI001DA29530|nr:hypothetical protein [Nitrosomonas sp.]MCB1949346.1 hypothetical protein [Nitrosomonas sp.]MCP5242700.1 hypothetical protein [Burkholderiales bacterium]